MMVSLLCLSPLAAMEFNMTTGPDAQHTKMAHVSPYLWHLIKDYPDKDKRLGNEQLGNEPKEQRQLQEIESGNAPPLSSKQLILLVISLIANLMTTDRITVPNARPWHNNDRTRLGPRRKRSLPHVDQGTPSVAKRNVNQAHLHSKPRLSSWDCVALQGNSPSQSRQQQFTMAR